MSESFEMIKRVKAQQKSLIDVEQERNRQDDEFGKQVHDPAYWLAIMGKQMGQLGEAIIKHKWRGDFVSASRTRDDMYHEAAQVAAVAVAMMEAILLDELPDEVTSVRPKDPRKLARALGISDERVHSGYMADEIDRDELSLGRPVEDAPLPEEKGMSNDLC